MSVEVHLQNVVKSFDDVAAVDDVTLDVEKGELFFLLGPSGCGKTTCLRIIAGFYQPDSGNLYFDERPMNDVPPHKRNTGMVFQNYALWPHMTAVQNILYGMNHLTKVEAASRLKELLESMQLEGLEKRHPDELSAGQARRVAIARALAPHPKYHINT